MKAKNKENISMCSDKHEYIDRMENGPQKCLNYFSAKFATYEIRPRARGCRLTDLTPCKRASPLSEWLPALKIIYFY